jgi:diguanylate cyclase (GGDEF)-like protein/PAS domain S-box-containing protein
MPLDDLLAAASRLTDDTLLAVAIAAGVNLLALATIFFLHRRERSRSRRIAKDLDQSRHMLQLVLDNIPQRVFWKDRDLRYLGCNKALAEDAGLAPGDIIGKTDLELPWKEDAELYRADDREVMTAGAGKPHYEEPMQKADGSVSWLETTKLPLRDADGTVVGVLGTYEDITERKRAQSELLLRERAIESSVNAIFITDHTLADQPVVYVNPAFERITGYAEAEILGRNCRFLQGTDNAQPGIAHIRDAVRAGRAAHTVLRNYRKDGSLFWNDLHIAPVLTDDGQVTHYVGVLNDITDTRRYQEQLEHQATHDALTGLPNRGLLMDRLHQAILHARRYESTVTVVFVNLDRFKNVNDALGHDAGDRLLQAAARRLQACVRATDTVARLGSDEFILVLAHQVAKEAIPVELQRVLDTVSSPLELDGKELYVTASLGASIYPQDGQEAETLLQHADTAMGRAKKLGRNTFQCYDAEMNHRLNERLALLASLRHALARDEFVLHYQPRLVLATGQIVGVEALIRWQHPELGLVPPNDFIPLAEESGLIEPIGAWVLETACQQARAWIDAGLPPMHMAVNISARQFRRRDLAQLVRTVLQETGLPAALLELELTESLLMEMEEAELSVRALKALGVQVAIDDFGTGYSSLSYLRRFHVDRLKIDRSFVREMATRPDDAAIAKTIIALGHTLKMKVVAEGVETAEQASLLHAERCDEVQGFYYSRPVPAEDCARLLRHGRILLARAC